MYLHDTITLCQDHIRASNCEETDGFFLSTSRYLPAERIAAKTSEFLDVEFCTDLLFYFGVWVSSYFKNSSWTVWFDIRSNLACKLTLIVEFQESGRRRTTLWICYLQNIIYLLFIYLINLKKYVLKPVFKLT